LLIPAAAARNISRSLSGLVAWAVVIAAFSCVVGILAPMQFHIPVPTGGAIVIVAALVFALTTLIRGTAPQFRGASV